MVRLPRTFLLRCCCAGLVDLCDNGGSRPDCGSKLAEPASHHDHSVCTGGLDRPDRAPRCAPRLAAELGQPILLENMAGVGGIAGVSRVAKAAANGYQFVLGNVGTHAQNQFLFAYPPYDASVEFVPAALLIDQAMLLAARPACRSLGSTTSSLISASMLPACSTPRPGLARQPTLPVHC